MIAKTSDFARFPAASEGSPAIVAVGRRYNAIFVPEAMMSSDPKTKLAEMLTVALESVAPGMTADIQLERPRDPSHGDFASNLAMQLARALKDNPRKIAERLLRELPASPLVQKEIGRAHV